MKSTDTQFLGNRDFGACCWLVVGVAILTITFESRSVAQEKPAAREKAEVQSSVDSAIAAILARPELEGSTVGFVARHLKTGDEIVSVNAKALLSPASTTKLVSGSGALALLGKDFRWRTPVVGTAPVEDGVLRGDLVLVAKGDPNLSQRVQDDGRLRFTDKDHTYAGFSDASVVPGDPLMILHKLAKEVRAAGVKEVTGHVIVDDGHFLETTDSFVGKFSAACVNDSVVDVIVYPGDDFGDLVDFEYQPHLPTVVKIRNLAKTGDAGSTPDLWIEPTAGVASFEIRGTVPLGSRPLLRVGHLIHPARTASHYFVEALKDAGVKIGGEARTARFGPAVYKKYKPLAEHVSPPFSQALRVILKTSHNLHATMLPVTVGAELDKKGDRATGFARMRRYFERAGLDVDSIILESGSGGGRIDRLSASFLVDLLRHMARRDDFPVLWDALPISGVDGTLAPRFRTPLLRRRVRAKTGTLLYKGSFNSQWIYLSKSLAGFVDLRSKDEPENIVVFAILIGNTVCDNRKEGVDRLFRVQQDLLTAIVERGTAKSNEESTAKVDAKTDP